MRQCENETSRRPNEPFPSFNQLVAAIWRDGNEIKEEEEEEEQNIDPFPGSIDSLPLVRCNFIYLSQEKED